MHHETAHRVRRISLIFFVITAGVWLLSYLALANNLWPTISQAFFDYADLPTFFCALVFLGSATIVRLDLTDEADHHTTLAIWIVAAAILAGLTILDFFAA